MSNGDNQPEFQQEIAALLDSLGYEIPDELPPVSLYPPFICPVCDQRQDEVITIHLGVATRDRHYKYETTLNKALWKFDCGHSINMNTLEEEKLELSKLTLRKEEDAVTVNEKASS